MNLSRIDDIRWCWLSRIRMVLWVWVVMVVLVLGGATYPRVLGAEVGKNVQYTMMGMVLPSRRYWVHGLGCCFRCWCSFPDYDPDILDIINAGLSKPGLWPDG